MRPVLIATALLATLAAGILIGVYAPLPLKHKESVAPVSPEPMRVAADPDAIKDRREMLSLLRLMQQEVAELRTTTSQLATLCGQAMGELEFARTDGMDDVATNMDRIRQRLDSVQLGRDLAEIDRHRSTRQAEIDATYERLTGRLRQSPVRSDRRRVHPGKIANRLRGYIRSNIQLLRGSERVGAFPTNKKRENEGILPRRLVLHHPVLPVTACLDFSFTH